MEGRRRRQARARYRRKKLIAALRWQRAWGDKISFIRGNDLPAWRNRPQLGEHLSFVWQAFLALSSDRQIGMDVGPIMFSSIEKYAERFGIDGVDAFDRFSFLIRAMDRAYLASNTPPSDVPPKD